MALTDCSSAPLYSKQPLSQRRNPPSVAFGTVTRDQLKLVYISQEHSRAQPSLKPSPGPDYQYGSMLGKQVSSTVLQQCDGLCV